MILVVNGDQVLSKWNKSVNHALVPMILLDLLTSAESLDGVLVGSKDQLSLNGQALKGVWLPGTYSQGIYKS